MEFVVLGIALCIVLYASYKIFSEIISLFLSIIGWVLIISVILVAVKIHYSADTDVFTLFHTARVFAERYLTVYGISNLDFSHGLTNLINSTRLV